MTPHAHDERVPDNSPETVFVVDDDPDIRRSITLLARSVGLQVETFASGREFLQQFDRRRNGCLILDVRMPGMTGPEVCHELKASACSLPIIYVTAHAELPFATRAIKAGAVDYIQKPFSPQTLLERIQEALTLDRENRRKSAQAQEVRHRLAGLTEREREVMWLLAEGQSTKHIAHQLSISRKTVDNHRSKIMEKTQVENPTQLSHLLESVHHDESSKGPTDQQRALG